jgi:hypothetical protein
MEMNIALRPLAAATAGLVLSVLSSVALGERVPFEGTQHFSVNSVPHMFKSGSTIVHQQGRAIMHARDRNSIFHNMTLECAGVINAPREGQWKAEGYCDHIDRDGDTWVGRWWADQSTPATKWEVMHGTGKYIGASGNGTGKYTELRTGPDALAVVEVTGFIELKR